MERSIYGGIASMLLQLDTGTKSASGTFLRRFFFTKSHFPKANTGTKDIKMLIYFLCQNTDFLERSRTKIQIEKI